jgi:hypothetical protein
VEQVRLADLLAGLSLVADAGMGLEPGEAARAALVAMELANAVDAPRTYRHLLHDAAATHRVGALPEPVGRRPWCPGTELASRSVLSMIRKEVMFMSSVCAGGQKE